MTLKIILRHA